NQYRMVLLPRAHFKTTVATVADSIQCALPDCGTVQQWPRGLGTNVRVLYAHESHEGASRFLYETTRHFTGNPRLMGLFPNLVRLKLDHIDIIGTRYSLDDVYAHAMKTYGNRLLKYIRRIKEKENDDEESKFIFPEEFDDDAVIVLKKNIKVWNAQYVNDPHEGLAEFDLNWKKFYHHVPGRQVAAFFGSQTIAPTKYKISDLDIIIIVDPAVTGKSGFIVTGTDAKLHVFVLEAIKGYFKPPELVQKVFDLVQKYWPRLVAFEEVIFSANYKPW